MLSVGSNISFCPDLDRGAFFDVLSIEPVGKEFNIVLLYKKGRWKPSFGQKFNLKVYGIILE